MTVEDLRLLELIAMRARDQWPRPEDHATAEYDVLNALAYELGRYAKYLEDKEAKLADINTVPSCYEEEPKA